MKKPVRFGKYLLLDRVNVGGMAEVFLAKPLEPSGAEMLAIKRILPTMVEDTEFLTMFLDEARISAQLNHANIVQIHELGKHEDDIYIAMDYVSGKDLRQLIEKHRASGGAMPVAQAVFLALQICQGLDYAHRKKDVRGAELHIVHRDVSPQNILLSYGGDVKLIDFGIAKAAGRAQKTQAGILKGKFGYMSPEQVCGLPIDHRSDLFAVGVTLFEMLTGERLFAAESDFSTLERVRTAQVPAPRELNAAIPEELEGIMLKALARDADDRYPWCSDLREALLGFARGADLSYSSKELGQFLHEAFVDDCAREGERLARFAALTFDPSDDVPSAARGSRAQVVPVGRQATAGLTAAKPPRQRPLPPEDIDSKALENAVVGGEPDPFLTGPTQIFEPGLAAALAASRSLRAPAFAARGESDSVTMLSMPAVSVGGLPAQGDGARPMTAEELRDAKTVIGVPRPPQRARPLDADPGYAKTVVPSDAEPTTLSGNEDELGAEPLPEPSKKAPAPRSMLPLVAAGVASVLAVAAAGFLALRPPRPGMLFVLAEPDTASIAVDGKLVAAGEMIALAPGQHAVAVTASGFEPYRKTVALVAGAQVSVEVSLVPEAPPAPTPVPDAPARPAPASELRARPERFDLKIESRPPGALIELAGRRLGETPRTLPDLAPDEARQVTLSLKGYRPAKLNVDWDGQSREVSAFAALVRLECAGAADPSQGTPPARQAARPGESAAEHAKMPPRLRGVGRLVTNSEPVARVAIDGKDTGRWTPISLSQPLELPSGDHIVTYTDSMGRKAVRPVNVHAGEMIKVIGIRDFQ